MNVSALIDAIVRQTTVLLAQLATAEGGRAQLAHTANQVFLNLVEELKAQGLSSKVIADMFGLALRTYQERVRRLSESQTVRGRSLWEAVLEYVEHHGPVSRAAVLGRFKCDDPATVRGVLQDLVHSATIYRTGRGDSVTYRKTDAADFAADVTRALDTRVNLVWIAIQRQGRAGRAQLGATLNLHDNELDEALQEAVRRGHIREVLATDPALDAESESAASAERIAYESSGCVLPYDDPKGWEAAVFDHYQALVTSICAKLQLGQRLASRDDMVGGSTFGLCVWPGHPHYEEAVGLLKRWREQGSELRQKILEYNAHHDVPAEQKTQVVAYVGQHLVEPHSASRKDDD